MPRLLGLRLPGLHSIHWKVFVFHMVVLTVPIAYIGWKVQGSIETSNLHSTEEGMIDTAVAISQLYARIEKESGNSDRVADEFREVFVNLKGNLPLKTQLFGYTKNEVDIRLLAYDQRGHVIFDTEGEKTKGADFSQTRDVRSALAGQYGSRWELDQIENRVNLYSSLPVMLDGKVIGAVTVAKPTNRIRNFVFRSFEQLLIPGLIALLLATALAYALSAYITRIIGQLASQADRVAAGEANVRLETWTRSELGMLARAVEKMREKLEGKAYVEEMVSNFSHELKTPLASIRGAAEILEDGAMNDPSARARFLSNIRTDVQRLDRVVTNFLKLSRIEARLAPASADSIDLTSACREIIEIYRAQAERCGIQIRATLPNVPVKAQIGESELKQIVGNLLENALQFTPQGRAITLSLTTEDSHAVLRVRDEGCGIEPDLLPRIFERFFTTENPRTKERGTGLGLAIVRSLVEANHGSISAKSQRGAGAEFEVRFPGFPERP